MDQVTIQTIIDGLMVIILVYIGGVLTQIFKALKTDKAELERIREEIAQIRKDTDIIAGAVTTGGGDGTGRGPSMRTTPVDPTTLPK
ncbi:MAG TPA: hypothetical protein PLP23_22790 [Panacibacter sp.]|nr:hypothetical protein [Panacibacter sp.]